LAGFWGIIITIAAAAVKKETRMGIKDILWALEMGAKRTVPVAIACASVGLVIGVCTLTGVSSVIGNYILNLSHGSLYITLALVMILSIIMGMGLPTVAVYVLLAAVAVPVIAELNVPLLAAHFFVFYFGMMANVTPPVAIPAYAAAGLAGANPSKVGWAAFKLAIAAFIVPYMFVMSPELLLVDYTWAGVLSVGLIGVVMLGIGVEGYLLRPMLVWQRVLIIFGSLMLIKPGLWTDIIGISALALIIVMQKVKTRSE
jgi:TRAP transporter 4TM/12TM fusion protein